LGYPGFTGTSSGFCGVSRQAFFYRLHNLNICASRIRMSASGRPESACGGYRDSVGIRVSFWGEFSYGHHESDGSEMNQESAFLHALATIAAWEVRGERLQLRRADGAVALDLAAAVTGTVTVLAPRPVPLGAEIRVLLQDISRMDVPATVIGEQVLPAADIVNPATFQVTFDPAQIDPRYTYSLRATVTYKGKLLYTSTQVYPVITGDAPRYDIEIQLEPIGL
jgi:putative lipoprotein